jgi:hypothetical protein
MGLQDNDRETFPIHCILEHRDSKCVVQTQLSNTIIMEAPKHDSLQIIRTYIYI